MCNLENEAFTHNCSAEACFRDCSLPLEMMHPDSIDEIHIQNIPDGQKTEKIASIATFESWPSYETYLRKGDTHF